MEHFETTWTSIEQMLDVLVEDHQKALLQLGRRIVPTLTQEDVLQPNDYPALENHPEFRYEEGLLAGLQTARMALRAMRRETESVI